MCAVCVSYHNISESEIQTWDDGARSELEFLILGDLLRSSLESHIAKKNISTVSAKLHSACVHCTAKTETALYMYH